MDSNFPPPASWASQLTPWPEEGQAYLPGGRPPTGGINTQPTVNERVPANLNFVLDTHRYARVVDQSIPLTTVNPQLFLNAPHYRRNLLILTSIPPALPPFDIILIGFGQSPTVSGSIRLQPGMTIIFDAVVPQDDLWCRLLAAGGQTTTLAFSYSTIPIPAMG